MDMIHKVKKMATEDVFMAAILDSAPEVAWNLSVLGFKRVDTKFKSQLNLIIGSDAYLKHP